MNFWSIRVIWSRLKAIRFMMADRTVKKTKKALVIAGVIYLLMPLDLVPALAFPLSLIDDFAVWALIIWYLKKELDNYWTGEKNKDLSKKYKNKSIIDDVEYEVNDSERKEQKNGQ